MTRESGPVQDAVRAFRVETAAAAAADGRATRARVLAAAARGQQWRAMVRRAPLLVMAALAALSSAAGAWTAFNHFRRSSAVPARGTAGSERTARPAQVHAAKADAPPPPEPAPVAEPAEQAVERLGTGAEERLYARAHRAHFVDGAPGPALAAWDHYLRRHPHGTFAPEARYNRALCLLRLGDHRRAADALAPFAEGAFGGYRQSEARALLEVTARQAARR